jgi:hypothetical protein
VDQPSNVVGDVPDVDVHPGKYPVVGEPERDELAAGYVAAERAIAKRFDETDSDVLATIGRKSRETPPVAPVVTGEVEARLIALARSSPPQGYTRWSLRPLERHVALAVSRSPTMAWTRASVLVCGW